MRLILFMILLLTVGCFKDPDLDCTTTDCNPGSTAGNFRIVRNDDGTDLLFGPNRAYDPTYILFYSIIASDTTFYPGVKTQWGQSTGDSVLKVDFPSEPPTVFIKLNSFDTDTLQVSYQHFEKNNCCEAFTQIAQFIVNGQQVVGGQPLTTQTIRK